ncbi:hypothetical protein [Frigoribacterium sp. CFBP9030]|uniref:hypothetical protein n=1 Tax=Frigoribacterium sp. CFBP9030 TaxID=3096537 RepID=UPI002A69F498|nr:hypothetical protein [Frigoribacterium sp. CFBP9030]MDY0892651.1 hypothetical protein [Frigoribacterium sp. CFBP9030]
MQSTRTSFRSSLGLVAVVAVAVGLAGCSAPEGPRGTVAAAELEGLLPGADEVSAATDDEGGAWRLEQATSADGTSAPDPAAGSDAASGAGDGDLGICAMDFRSFTAAETLPSASAVFTRERQQFTTGVVSRDDAAAYIAALRDELAGCPATTTAGVSGTESSFTLTPFDEPLAEADESAAVCFGYAASFGGAPARGHACQVAQGDLVTLSWVLAPTDREALDAAAFARLVDLSVATSAS